MDNLEIENVVVIGGGPAGLAAAIYLSRANLKPLLFAGSPPGGQLTLTTEVENYPGYENIMGPELIEKMRSHATKFGTRIVNENVLSVDFTKPPFTVTLREGVKMANPVRSKSILIATGAKALWLGLESETRLRGKGVSACATCDGFFFRNKVVAVVGGGDTAIEEAMTLTKFASKVYLIHRRDTFRASKIMQDRVLSNPKIEVIWNSTVEEVLGEQKVEGIGIKSTTEEGKISQITVDGLFLAIGHKPDTELFKNKIELDEKGYVITSAMKALESMKAKVHNINPVNFDFKYQMMTSIPGVFAAGDNVDHTYRQAITAAGMGVQGALDIERWLELG